MERHICDKTLIHNDKDHPRTDPANAGRFRFALRVSRSTLGKPSSSTERSSHNQRCVQIRDRLRTDVLDPAAAFLAQKVKPQTVVTAQRG
jgi:hypothetical protein